MAWTKHLSIIKTSPPTPKPDQNTAYASLTARTASWLNIAYQGNPQRIPRYYQFQEMDNDSDINTALDTIADFCTQSEEQNDEPFQVDFNGEPNESEVKIIKQMLAKWVKINKLRARLWYMFRDCIKNGDAFFLRDPETHEWLWLDHFMVELVKVDESKGKVPEEYIVRGLDYNRQSKFATKQADPNAYRTPFGTASVGPTGRAIAPASSSPAAFTMAGTGLDQRMRGMQGPYSQELSVVDAEHVVHLSLNIGNDINWPFGSSVLEPVFKTYKQKELLEDAIIIYRVQRAPERRIFYIDVGTMAPERAKRHIESIKNDIHQRRIPNRTGTGGCFDMATRVPLLDGRTLSISELASEYEAGKVNWAYSCDPATGEIVPGKITWAGITRRDAKVLRLTLDNGETIICTPDHKFPILGRGKTEAKDIAVGTDSLVSFNTRSLPVAKVVSIEEVNDPITVGTITIDGNEELHGFHTFALEQGVFTFNSVLDAAYNPLSIQDDYFLACLKLDTAILLTDGRTLSLREIIDEFEQGKQNSVYSCDPVSQTWEHGLIEAAAVTRKNAELVRIMLDNGCYVDATPDHRFILEDGIEVEAGELVADQYLLPYHWDEGDWKVRVVAVQPIDAADTGDITISTESGSHIFALGAGIYVHNSGADGRGSKVETLPGGDSVGEITDLTHFSRKLARGLRVPTSYLNIGENEQSSGVTYNDGKLGAAMIQEYRFSKHCMRLQSLLAPTFDKEFKRYLQKNGIEIEHSLFDLQFSPPQSFTRYRQIELDAQRIQVYSGVADNRRLSERFKLKRFLGLNDDEIIENEEMWAEENPTKMKQKTGSSPAETGAGTGGLSAVGLHPSEMGDMPAPDEPMSDPGDQPAAGAAPGGPDGAGVPAAPPVGGGATPPVPAV